MNIATLLPFILIIGVMMFMTRATKNKQRQAQQMRDQMQPGNGVRTIGGIVALVKDVRDSTVLLEVAPGVHTLFAKTAIHTVLSDEEYDRLVNNDVPLTFEDTPEAEEAEEAEVTEVTEEAEAADEAEETGSEPEAVGVGVAAEKAQSAEDDRPSSK